MSPLADCRLWVTLLWAIPLSVAIAGLDWADRRLATLAGGRTVMLLPATDLNAQERQALADQLARDPAIAVAQWRSPADQSRRVAERFPQAGWSDFTAAEDARLPWILELRPRNPLGQYASIQGFIARRRGEDAWKLVLWDAAAIQDLIRTHRQLWTFVLLGAALTALAGAAALALLPLPSTGRAAYFFWSILLAVATPAAIWAALRRQEAAVDSRSLAIAAAAGFILAAIAAPVLKLRKTPHIALTLSEENDERENRG